MFGRRGRAGKRILLFTIVTSSVVLAGLVAMTAYALLLRRGVKEQKREVPYEVLEPSEAHQTVPQSPAKTEQETAEGLGQGDILAAGEELYFEALEQGQNALLVECASTERVTLAFAGDILLDDSYAMMSKYTLRGSSIQDTFSAGLLEKMRSADVFMLNNEFTFTTRGQPTPDKQFTFRAKPENVEFLHQLGVDIVSLANNHAYDYGEVSLLDTMATLDNAGIAYVGAGENLAEAVKPTYIIANGMKIAIVSATQIERNGTPDTKGATETSPGVFRCMNPDNLLTAIREAEENSDFTILYIHWGTEGQEGTDWLQEEQAPLYAEAGVDLIIGDHPHCLQRLDVVSGVPVIYSLGNYWFNSKTQNTCLIEISIKEGVLENFRFVPCRQSDCRTLLLEGAEKEAVLEYMRSISPNVEIDGEGNVRF